ncbi:MAG: hypothetical protein PHI32_13130 [Dysgonamonadaceae bacterium]|nr:hypothetical protein [Dysgonamonadaceae bacterium]
MRWNLKEALGKVSLRGTRIISGITVGMSLLNKSKSKDYTEQRYVNMAETWNER